jgi:DNA-binding beta-propeller fold protein YncE
MPLNGSKLSYAEVKSIKEWIDSGAPDISGNVMWADNPDRKKFYAVNQGCDLITVFDGNSQLPMRCVEVGNKPEGDAPHQLRVSPDGKYWYVLFINNNILQKFRCSDDSYVGSIPLTPLAAGTGTENNLDWNTFVISSDGKRAYCASWTRNGRVSAVDLENARLLHYSPVLFEPHGIALNATEDKLYVAAQTGNFITELDTAFTSATPFYLDNTSSPNTESSVDPHDLILSPDGNAMLITCQKTNDVRVFDMTLKKVTQIVPTGVYPQEIIYSSASKAYFVSCTEDNVSFPGKTGVLTRIDAQNYATQKLQCGHQPHGIAVDEGKKILYVLSRNVSASGPAPHHTSQCAGKNGFINFVDLNTFSLLPGRYELSVDPYFIAARP